MDQFSGAPLSRSGRSLPWQRALGIALILIVLVAAVVAAVIVLSSDAASRDDIIGQAIRLSVTLLIPAVVMIAYWLVVQRQVGAAKSDLQDRLDSGHDLIARVSHQLRDQLTVIYGFSEALLDSDMSDKNEVHDVVTIINAEAVDLSRIVDDLVSAAEMEAGEFNVSFSKFDPSIEVERVVLPFRRRGHEISVDCWSGTAISDPIRFRQVVRTLLSNATQHGGPTVGFVGELSNGSFLCTVVDDGDGMNSDLEGQFFNSSADEPKSASEVQGSGLGLTVSHAIAHQLGGRLRYQRTSDLTMVTIVLPTDDWPAVPAASDSPNDADGPDDETADDSTAIAIDEDAAEADPDIDQEDEDTKPVTEVDGDASGADWVISFDEEDNQEPDPIDDDDDHLDQTADEEDADRHAEEAEAAVEAPANT
jgi:signal transduction histidine kinase